jgi:hypothetical protein
MKRKPGGPEALVLGSLFLALMPSLAHAYIGPGTGLSGLGSLLALLGAIVVGIFGFVWYPVKRLLKRIKNKPGAGQS